MIKELPAFLMMLGFCFVTAVLVWGIQIALSTAIETAHPSVILIQNI